MTASADSSLTPQVRGTTRLVGIIGWPVEHSLSPAIHNAAFREMGMDWAYVPLPVEPGRLAAALEGLRSLGFAGANVTMPHKTEAAELADSAPRTPSGCTRSTRSSSRGTSSPATTPM